MKIKKIFIYLLFSIHPFLAFPLSISDLSLEEKAGQVLMVHFNGKEATDEIKKLIRDIHIGGVIYYQWANGLDSPQDVFNLSKGLQQQAFLTLNSIPLFIAVDQEGGCVNRLKKGFTLFPGNYALGISEEWGWGRESAFMIGKELDSVGISMNLAPIVDINNNDENPIIGIRSFGKDPLKVARWGKSALQGYQEAGIISALKHFPGHGDVKADSHVALPVVNKTRKELEEMEFIPFRILSGQADAIMTAHLLLPAWDPIHCVTFSKKVVQDLLRKELNFSGLIMTDSLAMMGALSQYLSVEEAVLASLEAGHDLILMGGKQLNGSLAGFEFTVDDIRRVHRYLVEAIKHGRLSEQRLNDAVMRILSLKKKYRLFDFKLLKKSFLNSHSSICQSSHQALAQKIASRALRLLKGKELLPFSLSLAPMWIVAPEILREEILQTSWGNQGSRVNFIFVKNLNPDSHEIEQVIDALLEAEQCCFFAYNLWQFSGLKKLFQQIREKVPMTIAVAVKDPQDANFLTLADVLLCSYSPVKSSLQAAYDCLFKNAN